ncbi:MAG: tRNA dihydrouridine synthase DusB [Bacteroidales bacterium]|jgi:nifR3 family TIM-barrel protein|nr:tRNA dihydrouridine synthase DusB [Bacteroidales bacterium]
MKIGNIELGLTPLFLAPMEEVTGKAFRMMCKRFGADVMCTEFVSSEALIRDVKKTKLKMCLFDFDRPAGIQLYGHDIASMVEAAKVVESFAPDFIDLNFGCPMKKIAGRGAGAGLLQNPDRMQQMADAVVKAVKVPVTAKTRLGWDNNSLIINDVAHRLQDVGIVALTIHGRTKKQLYTGEADWRRIAEVKNAPGITIPIIGNGDIDSAAKAARLLNYSGVDGLMIGRAAIGRPWLFHEIKHFFQTGEFLPPPTVAEVVAIVREQLQLSIEWKDDVRTGILLMRRHFARYFPGLPDFRPLRIRLLQADSMDALDDALNDIVARYGGMRIFPPDSVPDANLIHNNEL